MPRSAQAGWRARKAAAFFSIQARTFGGTSKHR